MNIFETIQGRRSVHSFFPERKIPREDLEKLFQNATLAPSSWNLQPWKFLVIEDDEKRAAIRRMAWDQPIVTESSPLIVVLGDTNTHRNDVEIFAQWQSNGISDDSTRKHGMHAVDMV